MHVYILFLHTFQLFNNRSLGFKKELRAINAELMISLGVVSRPAVSTTHYHYNNGIGKMIDALMIIMIMMH